MGSEYFPSDRDKSSRAMCSLSLHVCNELILFVVNLFLSLEQAFSLLVPRTLRPDL